MKVDRLIPRQRCQEQALVSMRGAFLSLALNGFGWFTKTASRSSRSTGLQRFNEAELASHYGSMDQRLDFTHAGLSAQFTEHFEGTVQIFHAFVTFGRKSTETGQQFPYLHA